MKKRPTASPRKSATSSPPALRLVRGEDSSHRSPQDVSLAVPRVAKVWLQDGRAQGWSEATVRDRDRAIQRVCWWMEHEAGIEPCLAMLTTDAIREFLIYAREANPKGRYGSDRPCAKREARPATVHAYYRILRAFLNFCVEEGHLAQNPMDRVRAPRVPTDQIQPFSEAQLQSLLDAARRSRVAERDVAIILVLLDTGLRVSELCQRPRHYLRAGTDSPHRRR